VSVINQMLQDLERRRGSSVVESPLGGLSASGNVLRSGQPMNYVLFGAVLVLAIVAAFLFGSQRSSVPYTEISKVVPILIETPKLKNDAVEVVVVSGPDSLQSVKTEQATKSNLSPLDKLALLVHVESLVEKKMPRSVVIDGKTTKAEKHHNKVLPVKNVPTVVSNISAVPVLEKIIETQVEEAVDEVAPVEMAESITPVVIVKRVRPLTDAQQAQQYFQKAVLHLGRGERDMAQAMLDKSLLADSSHIGAREALAGLFVNTGRISEASMTLHEGLRINSRATGLAKLYARILVDQGDTEKSIAVLERARPLVSNDPEYHALMAVIYSRVGKHGQAAQTYQQILNVRPGVPQWWMGLGLSFESMNDSKKALLSYQRAQRVGGLAKDVNKFVADRIHALSLMVSVKDTEDDIF